MNFNQVKYTTIFISLISFLNILKIELNIYYYITYIEKIMERRINKKFENYLSEFKENVKEKALEMGTNNDNALHQLVQYIYDYERFSLVKEDFMKRKRVKNIVHLSDRCCAKRANGEQCTRRRKDDKNEFCGTHLKGTPHGICDQKENPKNEGIKIEVWAQDIQGIIYYIDKAFNVYQVEDIMQSKVNPKVIAKYVKVGDTYMILNNER